MESEKVLDLIFELFGEPKQDTIITLPTNNTDGIMSWQAINNVWE